MDIVVRPGSQRYVDAHAEGVTHHSFSFGHHYDPDNLAFGPMRAFDDHHLSWGAGFDPHQHSQVELVTWVLHGTLVHSDDQGATTLLPAGSVQVQSAGTGIRHGEHADSSGPPTRFVQTWLVPDEVDLPPARFSARGMDSSTLRPVAGEGAEVPVGTAGATLWFGRLAPGTQHEMPVCGAHHLFLATGQASLEGLEGGVEEIALEAGDAVRISGADDVRMGLEVATSATEPAEVLLWTFRTPE